MLLHGRHLTIFLRPEGRRVYWRMIHCAVDEDALVHRPEYFHRFWNYWMKKWRLPPQGPELIGFCMHTWLVIQSGQDGVAGESSFLVPQDLLQLPTDDLPWRFQMTLPLTAELSVWLGLTGNWSQVFPHAHFWHPFQGLVRWLSSGSFRVSGLRRGVRVVLVLYDEWEEAVWLVVARYVGGSRRFVPEFFTSMERVQGVEALLQWSVACQMTDVHWVALYLPEVWLTRLAGQGGKPSKRKVVLVWSSRQIPPDLPPVLFAWKSLLELPIESSSVL